jgi:hypothetical protein
MMSLTPHSLTTDMLLADLIAGDAGALHRMADGAYDGEPTYQKAAERDICAAVIIPPRITAVPGPTPQPTHSLATASADKTTRIVTVVDGRELTRITHDGTVQAVRGNA